MSLAPVLELGGTHVSAALVDRAAGAVVPGTLRREPVHGDGAAAEILTAILSCASTLDAEPNKAWGVALPGPFDYARGIAQYQGVGKFDSLYGVDLRAVLMKGLPGPPGAVEFVNDADAFLLGEWHYGAVAGVRRCAGITLGTGVGSAFLADGKIVSGGRGTPPEGRVDLLEIDGRSLEDTVSRRAIRSAYRRRTGLDLDVEQIAGRGDADSRLVFSSAFEPLGRALAPWLRAFGATELVVGGSISRSWKLVSESLETGLKEHRPRVSAAANPDHAALLGVAVR
jgi:glucokinase